MTQSNEKPAVVFKTKTGNSFVFNDLQEDTHYTFECRCGCGDTFAGYGKDIRSAAQIEPQPTILSSEAAQEATAKAQVEFIMKIRPYVSDRYIQKAIFKLSDDEIDALAEQRAREGEVDPVIKNGGGAEDNDPPEVGKTVYSRVTREGPFTVTDFTMGKIKIGEGDLTQVHQTWCGVLRTPNGDYINIPVGDLVKTLPEPPEPPKRPGPFDHLSPRARARAKSQARRSRRAKRFFTMVGVMLLSWSAMVTALLIYSAVV